MPSNDEFIGAWVKPEIYEKLFKEGNEAELVQFFSRPPIPWWADPLEAQRWLMSQSLPTYLTTFCKNVSGADISLATEWMIANGSWWSLAKFAIEVPGIDVSLIKRCLREERRWGELTTVVMSVSPEECSDLERELIAIVRNGSQFESGIGTASAIDLIVRLACEPTGDPSACVEILADYGNHSEIKGALRKFSKAAIEIDIAALQSFS